MITLCTHKDGDKIAELAKIRDSVIKEGREAQRAGKSYNDDPYGYGSTWSYFWNKGFALGDKVQDSVATENQDTKTKLTDADEVLPTAACYPVGSHIRFLDLDIFGVVSGHAECRDGTTGYRVDWECGKKCGIYHSRLIEFDQTRNLIPLG